MNNPVRIVNAAGIARPK